jgi:hypothetical protein
MVWKTSDISREKINIFKYKMKPNVDGLIFLVTSDFI